MECELCGKKESNKVRITEAKITKATFKSFIRKNSDNLYVKKDTDYDGMVDGIGGVENSAFHKAQATDHMPKYTLGIGSVWLVGNSSDYFTEYSDNKFEGIGYTNCCGSGVIAIKKGV